MKIWMYRLDCHNTRMTRVDCVAGVVQAETYETAERKVAENMTDYQCLSGLWEVDWENQASTSTWISR